MESPWEEDSCEEMQGLYRVYSVLEAAILWCNVPIEDRTKVASECRRVGETSYRRIIFEHPNWACIEPRSRAIALAMEEGSIEYGREDGIPTSKSDHVKYERRHVTGKNLKAWMEMALPNEKPGFLFYEHERVAATGVSLEAYQTLRAENQHLRTRLDKAVEEYKKLRAEYNSLNDKAGILDSNKKEVHPRTEASFMRLIGAMLECILGESPSVRPHPSFQNQQGLIAHLNKEYYDNDQRPKHEGLGESTLKERFPLARRHIEPRSPEK